MAKQPPPLPIEQLSMRELMSYRAEAIQAYALLEFGLNKLLAALLETDQKASGIVFYKITNARARNDIMEKLLHYRHGNTYNLFWNSLVKIIRCIDIKRNEVVHWHTSAREETVRRDDVLIKTRTFELVPPNSYWRENAGVITVRDMKEFSKKCKFISDCAIMFSRRLGGKQTQAWLDTWQQIFLTPAVYPPLDTHPLYPNYRGPDTPPQS